MSKPNPSFDSDSSGWFFGVSQGQRWAFNSLYEYVEPEAELHRITVDQVAPGAHVEPLILVR